MSGNHALCNIAFGSRLPVHMSIVHHFALCALRLSSIVYSQCALAACISIACMHAFFRISLHAANKQTKKTSDFTKRRQQVGLPGVTLARALHQVAVPVILRAQRRADSEQIGQQPARRHIRTSDGPLQDHGSRCLQALSRRGKKTPGGSEY